MTLIQPQDLWVGPIITSLQSAIQNGVGGLERIYTAEPDGPFENNSAFIPEPTWEVKGDTNAKLYLCVTFSIRHIVNRDLLSDSFAAARQYLYPYLMTLASWANQTLGGNAINIKIKKGGIGQWVYAGINNTALFIVVEVMTEFNIPVS